MVSVPDRLRDPGGSGRVRENEIGKCTSHIDSDAPLHFLQRLSSVDLLVVGFVCRFLSGGIGDELTANQRARCQNSGLFQRLPGIALKVLNLLRETGLRPNLSTVELGRGTQPRRDGLH